MSLPQTSQQHDLRMSDFNVKLCGSRWHSSAHIFLFNPKLLEVNIANSRAIVSDDNLPCCSQTQCPRFMECLPSSLRNGPLVSGGNVAICMNLPCQVPQHHLCFFLNSFCTYSIVCSFQLDAQLSEDELNFHECFHFPLAFPYQAIKCCRKDINIIVPVSRIHYRTSDLRMYQSREIRQQVSSFLLYPGLNVIHLCVCDNIV